MALERKRKKKVSLFATLNEWVYSPNTVVDITVRRSPVSRGETRVVIDELSGPS